MMHSLKKNAYKETTAGSALVMVLIMVVVLTVSLASVAMLNVSVSTSLKNSAIDSSARSEKVVSALGRALNYLSYDSSGASRRYGLADCGPGITNGLIGTYAGVSVYCKPHPSSGLNTAVASVIVTGFCSPGCEIGKDAGLRLSIASAPNNSCGDSNTSRLSLTAGIVNVSGLWDGVNCGSLSFGSKGKITQTKTATCPGDGSSTGSWWTGSSAGSIATYTKCVTDNQEVNAADISPTSESSNLGSFITSIKDAILVAQGTPVVETVAGNNCVVIVRNGAITSSFLTTVSSLMPNSCSTPTVFFANTDSGSMGRVMLDGSTMTLSNSLARVVFGQPNSSYTDCDTNAPGTQLQLTGSSVVTINGFTMIMCDPKGGNPSIAATSLTTADHFLTVDSGIIKVRGYVAAPSGSIYIKLVGSGTAEFSSGAMLRALRLQASANQLNFGEIPQPPELSGDRLVQLRFKEGDRDLGVVQVIIRDYYGRRRAVGIGFKAWRTLW